MNREFIASRQFLDIWQWRRIRYDALAANDGRRERCGRSKHNGIALHVYHISLCKTHPYLAPDLRPLQVLCGPTGCNTGGNKLGRD